MQRRGVSCQAMPCDKAWRHRRNKGPDLLTEALLIAAFQPCAPGILACDPVGVALLSILRREISSKPRFFHTWILEIALGRKKSPL